MHEAKAVKINEMLENGESDKVQWGDVLEEFTGLDLPRMLIALEKLSPCRIDSLIDVCNRAKEESKKRSFESIQLKMVEMGIDPEEFAQFMESNPKSLAKPSGRKSAMSEKVRKEIVEILKEEIKVEGYKLAEIRKDLEKKGYPVTPQNIYALRDRAKKELDEEQEAA